MIGNFVQQTQGYKAFIPADFPPKYLEISKETLLLCEQANLAIGRLDGVTDFMPNREIFAFVCMIKESACSNHIEGSRATGFDYVMAQAGIKKGVCQDVDDLICYNKALEHGLKRLKDLPLASRLICEAQEIVIPKDQKASKDAGNFRRSQNWIGGIRPQKADFVPPPHTEISRCMKDLDNFINSESYPILINIALAHAQFETIHPFLDGNGRTGRLLILLQLCDKKILGWPTLYLSSYFKRYKQVYYNELSNYRSQGGVNRWLQFFLEGLKIASNESIETSKKLIDLFDKDRTKIASLSPKQSLAVLKLLDRLYELPIMSFAEVAKIAGLSRPTTYNLIDKLVMAGILQKTKSPTKTVYYEHKEYISILLDS